MAAAPAAYTGMMSIGGASFTLGIDDSSFKTKLTQAEGAARNASQKIGQHFGRGGGASMGLLYLGQAVDDVQYGFAAIVNNIPQIVMGLGGSAGLAGGIGIAAVAVNQLITHWDTLGAKLSNTGVFLTATGAAEQFTESLKDQESWLRKVFGLQVAIYEYFAKIDTTSGKIAAAQAARMEAAGKAGEKIGDIKSKEAESRANDFKEAIRAYGGGAKLIKDVVDAQMKLTPGADRKMMETRVTEMITKGLAGEDVNKKFFGEGFGRQLANVQDQKNLKEEEKFQKKRMEQLKEQERADNEMLTKEGAAQAAVLEMQRDREIKALEEQERKTARDERILRKEMQDTNPSQLFTSGHAFASNMMTGALDSIGKEQVKQLEALNVKMILLREEMAKQRGMRFR